MTEILLPFALREGKGDRDFFAIGNWNYVESRFDKIDHSPIGVGATLVAQKGG
jgi:hypothetical protein